MPQPPIADVLSRHTPDLMKIAGVVGTGEGERGGKPAVLVLVERETPALRQAIPSTLEGYPVVVRATGTVRPIDSTGAR